MQRRGSDYNPERSLVVKRQDERYGPAHERSLTSRSAVPRSGRPRCARPDRDAANEHFSRYGYEKTTVSDLAKAIGFSKAYIYKFFESKQAIGEMICREP